MLKKTTLIFILLTSIFMTSCITPGSPEPAIAAVTSASESMDTVSDNFSIVIEKSDLSEETKAAILAQIKEQKDQSKEKLLLVIKYLSTLDDLDWKQYAALLYKDAKELQEIIKKLEGKE